MNFLAVGWIEGGAAFPEALSERISFLILALFFYQGFVSDRIRWESLLWPALSAAAGVSLIGLFQMIHGGLSVAGKLSYFQIGSTLGHSNNTAQWIAGLLAISVPFLREGTRERRMGWALVALSLIYLFLLRGRSVWLAVVLGALLVGKNRRWLLGGALGFAAAAAALAPGFLSAKASAFLYRWELWKSVFPMVLEKPLGWGPLQFEFSHLPYIAGELRTMYETPARSAHNEWLHLAIGEGIPAVFLVLVCVVTLGSRFVRRGEGLHGERLAAALLSILFLVESLFQFPLQNPWTLLLLSLLLAWLLAHLWKTRDQPMPRFGSVILGVGLLMVYFGGRSVYAGLYGETDDRAVAARACDWQPSNWRACRSKGFLELRAGDLAAARATFERSLGEASENYFAMRGLTEVELREGRAAEACAWIRRQNDLLREESPFYRRVPEFCR
ncbi:MAG: O-antigen ligase family protein [Bdellovibrionales bacterium]|nr:O-antigen ligase family protein [Bdellovibrionales bacterium]